MADHMIIDIKGRATRKPETIVLPSGDTITNVGLAVNRRWQNRQTNEWQDAVSFIDAKVPGQTGINLANSADKGDEICISNANLVMETWTKEGEKFSKLVAHCTPFSSVSMGLSWVTATTTKVERETKTETATAAANPLAGLTPEQIGALTPEVIAALMGSTNTGPISQPRAEAEPQSYEGEEPF